MEPADLNSLKGIYRFSKSKNTVYIDISIDFYWEIYNEWDFSPLINRDLDDDLFQYLDECAGEIHKRYKLCIAFHLPERIKEPEKEKSSTRSIRNFFNYQIRKQKTKITELKKKSLLYGLLGLLLLIIGSFLGKLIAKTLFVGFVVEGLTIGAWVLFWELFSTLFFSLHEISTRINRLQRLKDSKIEYHYR